MTATVKMHTMGIAIQYAMITMDALGEDITVIQPDIMTRLTTQVGAAMIRIIVMIMKKVTTHFTMDINMVTMAAIIMIIIITPIQNIMVIIMMSIIDQVVVVIIMTMVLTHLIMVMIIFRIIIDQ